VKYEPAPEHGISWHRPVAEVPSNSTWVEMEPGPYASADCVCGWDTDGPWWLVQERMRRHAEEVGFQGWVGPRWTA
jgi:hypothetical protein